MTNPVIIFGASAIGRLAKEIFESNGVVVYGFLDDDKTLHKTELDEVMVLGATDDQGFLKLIGKKCDAFVATDENRLRKGITAMLNDNRHVQPMNAVHTKASVSERASIGYGNFIDIGATVAVGAAMGNHNLVHAQAYVGPACRVGDFVQVGVGAKVGAGVVIENEVFIGAGAVIVAGVTLSKGARIGAGSVVIASVKAGETVFGNPAKAVG